MFTFVGAIKWSISWYRRLHGPNYGSCPSVRMSYARAFNSKTKTDTINVPQDSNNQHANFDFRKSMFKVRARLADSRTAWATFSQKLFAFF